MNILLIGPQGAGKGTQASLLVKNFDLYRVDAGELVREAAKTDPEIDRIVNQTGGLVPDDVIFSVVTRHLNKEKPERDNILFDGFPRSVAQYLQLKDWLSQAAKRVDLAILITISNQEAIRRLTARRICGTCGRTWNLVEFPKPLSETKCECGGDLHQREDDKPDLIKQRLLLFEEVTGPLIEMLDGEKKLLEVGGEHPVEEIYMEIASKIKK